MRRSHDLLLSVVVLSAFACGESVTNTDTAGSSMTPTVPAEPAAEQSSSSPDGPGDGPEGAGNSGGSMETQGGSSAGGEVGLPPAQGGSAQDGSGQGGSGQGGSGQGGSGQGGSDAQGGVANEPPEMMDENPMFTFFTTSEAGIRRLAPDKENGFGGDLGGLTGADEICATLARSSNPSDTKTWRAFLSATDDGNGNPVHAIERVGSGPWHDFNGRLLANNIAGLLPGNDGRPEDAEPQLAEMFTDENGEPISPDTNVVDNHDMLTGSDKQGRLSGETCADWTSKDEEAHGAPLIGHAWPRSASSGRHWVSDHNAGGCGAGIDTEKKRGNGTKTVGANGGYGGFFCFAVSD